MAWFKQLLGAPRPQQFAGVASRDSGDCTFVAERNKEAPCPGSKLQGLRDQTAQLAATQPQMWEHLLFFQALIEIVEGYESLRQERSLELFHSTTESVPQRQMFSWMRARFDESRQLVEQFGVLMNSDLPKAFGEEGQNGDASAIILVARRAGQIYRRILDISIRCASARHAAGFEAVFCEMSKINDHVTDMFEEFPAYALSSLMDALAAQDSGTPQSLNLVMVLTMDPSPLIAEIDRAEELFRQA